MPCGGGRAPALGPSLQTGAQAAFSAQTQRETDEADLHRQIGPIGYSDV